MNYQEKKLELVAAHEEAAKAYLALDNLMRNSQFRELISEEANEELREAWMASGRVVAKSQQAIQCEYGLKYP